MYHFEDFRKEMDLKKEKKESLIMHVVKNENSKMVTFDMFYGPGSFARLL